MSLISLSDVGHGFLGDYLFRGVTLSVQPKARIGLIGQNGTGKSTLLKIIAGELEPSEGTVVKAKGLTLGYQHQEFHAKEGATVYSELESVFAEDVAREKRLHEIAHELESATGEREAKLLAEHSRLSSEHEARGAFDIERRITSVLTRLGIPEDYYHQPISNYSGGERNVIGLAKTLLVAPGVILLDEPTNHLDMSGIEWFIRFIREIRSAVLMVSHSRHLLDVCCTEIWELTGRRIRRYVGNYTDFVQQKEERIALETRIYKNQQRTIERIMFQARRLMDMANAYDDPAQAKRAKSMLKRIERMDVIEKPADSEQRFHAHLSKTKERGNVALEFSGFSFAYGERVLLDDVALSIGVGDRVALVGPNGSGKTTLFREILARAGADDRFKLGASAKIGEYKQFHDEAVDGSMKLLWWLVGETKLSESEAADVLHRFLFSREDLTREISTLSGGEKSRLQLARLVSIGVNFLFLDEPTNHLDIQAAEQLEEMLADFGGTIFVISHDRYFLDKIARRVVEIRNRKLVTFEGPFAEWWAQNEGGISRRTAIELESQKNADASRREEFRRERDERKERDSRLRALRKELLKTETSIDALEKEKSRLSKELEERFIRGETPQDAKPVTDAFEAVSAKLRAAYETWERINFDLEKTDIA
ncbi:MAG: ATP-binding cassette domain-containing protein [Planctomycetes bacterium]|nr:ATP-binding cassette domain-containing protein [Planctomycetota bacterium]